MGNFRAVIFSCYHLDNSCVCYRLSLNPLCSLASLWNNKRVIALSNVFMCLCTELLNQSNESTVSGLRVPFCLLWWRDCLPQVPDWAAVLQRLSLLLVCQLRHGSGTDDPGRGVCLLLLGICQTRWHACLPSLFCPRKISQVTFYWFSSQEPNFLCCISSTRICFVFCFFVNEKSCWFWFKAICTLS